MFMRPPKPPWKRHKRNGEADSAIMTYYSSELSRLPIRAVERLDKGAPDNKQDPNLETRTFGLFSTCKRKLRSGIQSQKRPNLFFVTNTGEGRAITGYYEIGWYAPIPDLQRDIALAADVAYFVEQPIPIDKANKQCGTELSSSARSLKYPSPTSSRLLKRLLKKQPNALNEYVAETRRVETLLLARTGFTNKNLRRDSHFTWEDAKPIFVDMALPATENLSTDSPTNEWHCVKCSKRHISRRKLALCPNCNAPGAALEAVSET